VRVLAACQGDRAEATRRLAWSRAKFDRRIALAELSETVKRALDERRIKVGHAELLAAVPGDKQDDALETILSAGLDVGKTHDLLMRLTQDLGAASFDRSECTTCPFNSASQRTLFETHIDDGHCTNPACFELKTQAAEAIRFEEQECANKAGRLTASSIADQADHEPRPVVNSP
jgi:ParB family chromosome partitioning protein